MRFSTMRELLDFDAERMRFEECSLRGVNFFNLACDDLTIENFAVAGSPLRQGGHT